MLLDLVVLGALVWGIFIGYRKGILHSVFFLLGLLVGTLLALKLSHIVSAELHQLTGLDHSYLPLISFAILFLLGLGGMLLLAGGLEGILKAIQMNLVNRLAGALVWSTIALFITSTTFWYLTQYGIITENLISASVTYNWVAPLAPWLVDQSGSLLPWLKDLFDSIGELIKGAPESAPTFPEV